jgi:hypothetical protein
MMRRGEAKNTVSENTEHTAAPPGTLGPPTAAPVPRTARQRRPTGASPPLPHPIAISTAAWLLLVVVILGSAFAVSERTPWLRLGDRASTWLLRLAVDHPDDVLFGVAFNFAPGASALLAIDVDSAVALMPRATLVDWVRNREGLALCGWGAACPG